MYRFLMVFSSANLFSVASNGVVTVMARNKARLPGFGNPQSKESFLVYKELLSSNSVYMKAQIDKQRNGGDIKIQLNGTHAAHFEVYFNWIHKMRFSSEVEARRFLVEHFRGVAGGADRYKFAVDELCWLLRMGRMLEDTAFTTDAVRMMEESILQDSVWRSLHLGKMKLLWSMRELGSPGNVEKWVLERKSDSLTREEIESQRSTLDSSLLEALRKLTPYTSLTIRTGKGASEQKITVDRRRATMRSSVLANVLKAGSGDPPGSSNEKATLDASGEIFLRGVFQIGALNKWPHTLVEDGDELKQLLSGCPNIKTDSDQARNLTSALCGVCFLAEELGDHKLQRTIITALVIEHVDDPTKHGWCTLTWSIVTHVIANSPLESGLRRWVVDYVAYCIVDGKISVDYHKKVPAGMLKEVFARMHEIYVPAPGCDRPQLADLDRYCKPT